MIQEHIKDSIERYAEQGTRPGSFLSAVLSNNLRDAVLNADPNNRAELANLVLFCHSDLPAGIWGSERSFEEHIDRKQNDRKQKL